MIVRRRLRGFGLGTAGSGALGRRRTIRGRWFRDVLIGAGAGYAATRVMEKASTFLYERQSEEARRREEELRKDMPTTVLIRQVADWRGVKLENEQEEQLGMWLHYGFGAAGGPVATVLARTTRMGPLAAGLAVGTAMFVLVDEGANYVLGLTPPAPVWPLVTHLRALAAHLVYGLALGSLLAVTGRVADRRA
jgi:hypothetical protein